MEPSQTRIKAYTFYEEYYYYSINGGRCFEASLFATEFLKVVEQQQPGPLGGRELEQWATERPRATRKKTESFCSCVLYEIVKHLLNKDPTCQWANSDECGSTLNILRKEDWHDGRGILEGMDEYAYHMGYPKIESQEDRHGNGEVYLIQSIFRALYSYGLIDKGSFDLWIQFVGRERCSTHIGFLTENIAVAQIASNGLLQDMGWDTVDGACLIEQSLQGGHVALVDSRWLASYEGACIKRRQDLPPNAFVPAAVIKSFWRTHEDIPWKYFLIAVSHMWLEEKHPDPHGTTLRLIQEALHLLGSVFDRSPRGIFWDFASLYQSERTEYEYEAFRLSLSSIAAFFSDFQTHVFKVTSFPEGYEPPVARNSTPYLSRGWCFAEHCWSSMAKSENIVYDLARLSEQEIAKIESNWARIEACADNNRNVPLAPNIFADRVETLSFTNKEDDLPKLKQMYKQWFESTLGRISVAAYRTMGWSDDDGRMFCLALECHGMPLLQSLDLRMNNLGSGFCEGLVKASKGAPSLRQIKLSGNPLGNGVATLGRLIWKLTSLELENVGLTGYGCEQFASQIPGDMGHITHLQSLHLAENKIGDRGVHALAQLLVRVPTINISQVGMTSVGLKSLSMNLSDAFVATADPENWDLSMNPLGGRRPKRERLDRGVALGAFSPFLLQIQELNLADTSISAIECQEIVKRVGEAFIRNHTRIYKLKMSGNAIGDDGIIALLPILILPFRLELNKVGMTDLGCKALVQAYSEFYQDRFCHRRRTNPRLAKLHVRENLIKEIETVKLLASIQGVSDLYVDDNPVCGIHEDWRATLEGVSNPARPWSGDGSRHDRRLRTKKHKTMCDGKDEV